MQQPITTARRNIALLILAAFILVGCKVNLTSNSSSKWNVNGRLTATKRHNDWIRKLETTGDVKFQDGRITDFPKGALVKILETRGSEQRQAELRENAGKLELWMNDNGTFRKGSPEDEKWLEGFLHDFI